MLTQPTATYQPGLLQPHGTILVLGRGARVEAVGSNAEEVLGLAASACRGVLATELFAGEEPELWRAGAETPLAVELEVRSTGRRCWGTIRANEQGKRLLELESSGPGPALGAWATALDALGAAGEPAAVGRALARGLELLGCFDAVAIVRVDADPGPWTALGAGLGGPAPQLLAEAAAAPAELLGAGGVLDEGQDLAAARLRVPSPEALAALRALGGGALVHVPLPGAAAGEAVLAVAPRLTGPDRRAVELLVRAAERRLGELAARRDLQAALRARAACTQLLEAAARERAFERSLSGSLFLLQRLITNDGFALWTPQTCCAVGVAPRAGPLGEFVAAFDADRRVQRGACVLASAEEPLGRAARYLAAPLPDRGWLLWFRTAAEPAGVPDWSPGELHLAEALAHEVLPAAERVAATAAMGRSDASTLLTELSRERERRARERRHLLEFVSVASHDLRAPIRNLGSLVQWLREDHLRELSDDARQLVDLIEDRVRKATQLVDGVLAYSRLGVEDVPCEEVDLEALVGELLDILEVPARIRVEVERPLPAVRYRPLQLRQLLQNLLDNALKYNDKPQGVVRVRCHDRDAFWELQVEDDGVGIKPEDQERIFAIFRRASGSEQEDGTGVGLAIVKRIAEAHGGATWVESIPRRGSRFSVTIPKDPES